MWFRVYKYATLVMLVILGVFEVTLVHISSVFNFEHHHISTAFSWFDLFFKKKNVIYNLKNYLVILSSDRQAMYKCKGFLDYDAQATLL